MAYQSTNPLFRSLSDEEENQFKEWAANNSPGAHDVARMSVLHPVVRGVWLEKGLITREQAKLESPLPAEMEEIMHRGFPGDGSGEDDLADYNQNEADDYRNEGI